MIDENMPRWIVASIAKYFRAQLAQYHSHLEGEEHFEEYDPNIEIRIDGPDTVVLDKTTNIYHTDVDILIKKQIGKNTFDIQTIAGKVATAFVDIPIYKLGKETVDDETLVGCAELVVRDGYMLRITNYGQVDPKKSLLITTVDGHYRLTQEPVA